MTPATADRDRTRLRVLVFLPYLTLGGAERQAVLMASHLKARGHDVDVWGFRAPRGRPTLVPELAHRGLAYEEVPLWSVGWSYARFGFLEPAVRRWKWRRGIAELEARIPQRRYDVVVPFTFWPSLIAGLMQERLGARRWFWNHRGGNDGAGIVYNDFLVRKILDLRPGFIANSRAGANFVMETFRLHPGQVSVVPNVFVADGEDGPRPQAREHPAAEAPRDGELTLVHVANFYPEKDYITVLEGLRLLTLGGTACRLHFCGEFLEDADRSRFEARVRELDLADRVVTHGATERASVFALLSRADIGLLSSRSEGQPNSVMEYMHAELPVVATRIPGIQELVGEEGEEWLFDVGDAKGMARAVSRLAGDPARRAEIGRRNRRRLLENHAPERVLPRWVELVEGTAP